MKKSLRNALAGTLMMLASSAVFAQDDPKALGLEQITANYAMGQLRFLASDFTEGRATSTKGEKLSAHYIASVYEMVGLKPAGDIQADGSRSYFQRIPMIKRELGKDQYLKVETLNGSNSNEYIFALGTDYTASAPQTSLAFNSDIVFVGYGMVDKDNNYNDFSNVDLKGKVVVRLSGFPGHLDKNSAAYKKFAPTKRAWVDPRVAEGNKLIAAAGAVGIITINTEARDIAIADTPDYGSEYISSRKSYSIRTTSSLLKSAPTNISASRVVGETLVGDIDNIEKEIAANMKPQSKNLSNKRVNFKLDVDTEAVTAYNVLGMIEGKDASQTTVVAGHYDHMGIKDGFVWNGADDNASGTVAVMTIAKAFIASGEQPDYNIVFGAWTGEEVGFLGSTYFVKHFNEGKLRANVNFDMVSREITDGSNDVLIQHVVTMPKLLGYAKANEKKYKIGVNITTRDLQLGAGGSTDYAPFSRAMVPFVSWKGGHRAEYHRHTDEIETVDTEIFVKLIKMGFLSAWDLTNEPLK